MALGLAGAALILDILIVSTAANNSVISLCIEQPHRASASTTLMGHQASWGPSPQVRASHSPGRSLTRKPRKGLGKPRDTSVYPSACFGGVLSAVCLPGYAGVDCTACPMDTLSPGGRADAGLQCTPCEVGRITNDPAAASCSGGPHTNPSWHHDNMQHGPGLECHSLVDVPQVCPTAPPISSLVG